MRRIACVLAFGSVLATAARADSFKLKIIALNDFHGTLQSPGNFRANSVTANGPAGGVEYLAGYVAHMKSQNPYNNVVSAGDLIGASPLVSGLFHDEDTIETMNLLGLELSAVGNHEFDKGTRELLRMQNGGCSTEDKNTCKDTEVGTPAPFQGAKFKFLAANVIDTATGKSILPSYAIKTYNGIKVAFIGLTLKETPVLVTPTGVAGLRFADETETVNSIVQELRKQGIECFVVLIHQGGQQTAKGTPDVNGCEGGLEGSPIQSIVRKLDNAVDLVISAHTHAAYICRLANRSGRTIPVTSAASYGRLITNIDVTIDTTTKDATGIAAQNIVVERIATATIKPDAAIKTIVDKYAALAAPLTSQAIGSITAAITRTGNAAGESALGDLIADADLESTRAPGSGGAVVAFMNPGGIRSDLAAAGRVTYGQAFTVLPFRDNLVTLTLTGAQIETLLEEQFKGCTAGYPAGQAPSTIDRILQASEGFTYTWNPAGAICNKVDPGSIKIDGVTVVPTSRYRVTVVDFLADGGDQFYVLTKTTDRLAGMGDLDALKLYFAKHPSVSPSQQNRILVKP